MAIEWKILVVRAASLSYYDSIYSPRQSLSYISLYIYVFIHLWERDAEIKLEILEVQLSYYYKHCSYFERFMWEWTFMFIKFSFNDVKISWPFWSTNIIHIDIILKSPTSTLYHLGIFQVQLQCNWSCNSLVGLCAVRRRPTRVCTGAWRAISLERRSAGTPLLL